MRGGGYVECLEDCYFVLLLSCSITSCVLGSPDLLLSYSILAIPNTHTITIILIIILKSFCPVFQP